MKSPELNCNIKISIIVSSISFGEVFEFLVYFLDCLQIVKLLLDTGAHLDQPNRKGDTPAHVLALNAHNIVLLKYSSLKCLAATAVCKYGIPYEGKALELIHLCLKDDLWRGEGRERTVSVSVTL